MRYDAVNLETQNVDEAFVVESGQIVMDTPDRKHINTQISKFEESPVFNYLNNLSPIQPVKSVHIAQSFNSPSCASLPSVFTSSHVSSLKESRFLRRHQLSDLSEPEFSSKNGDKVCSNEEVEDIAKRQNCEAAETEEARYITDLNGSSVALVPYALSDDEECFFESEVHIGGTRQIDETKEASGCDWENLISDRTNLSMFASPNDSKSLKDPSQRSLEPGTSFCYYLTNDLPNAGAVEVVGLSQLYKADNASSQQQDGGDAKEIVKDQDNLESLSNCVTRDAREVKNDEISSDLYRGMRRRCLVFEMVGSRKKLLDDGSKSDPSLSTESHNNTSCDQSLAPIKPENGMTRCILPGIGLHLNALARPLEDKTVKFEALDIGEQQISASHTSACLNYLNTEDITNNSCVATASAREMLPAEVGVPLREDTVRESGDTVNEAFSHSSPIKKRRRLENDGESEACKRCKCKKSKCLKLYCECFAAGLYCAEPCSCQECFNKPVHENIVLATRKLIESRNPLAFAPKVIRSSDSMMEIGEESIKTPASARHKRGCNCKKSGCLKKYCECYQGGVGCSINCRCEGCKNAFGRKEGSEVEVEELYVNESEWSILDKSLEMKTIRNDADQNTNFAALPATLSQLVRQSSEQPFSLKSNKLPRLSFLGVGSSGMHDNQRFKTHYQTRQQDEMPEILQTNDSTISSVTTTSPNSKRVSPPHRDTGLPATTQRRSRKLVLQSIPSFPSLNS